MYMLDTDICVYLIKRKSAKLAHRIADVPREQICISTITQGELEYGVSKSQSVAKNAQSLAGFLCTINVLPFDDNAAQIYGDVRAELERKGTPIGGLDTLIAAHAKSLGFTIVTNNVREFERVDGLKVENWA